MKKLLLFILVLFGILSMQSLAGGCIAQVCTCPNGGYVSYGEYCATYSSPSVNTYVHSISAFAYDKNSGAYGVGTERSLNRDSAKKLALEQALKNCGTKNCKIIASESGLVATSSNGMLMGVNYKSYDFDKVKNKLIKKCEKISGTTCKIFWSTYGGFL